MLATAGERSLVEDWLLRRRYLQTADMPEQRRQMQLQLLDYLVRRYGDSPQAARPARFPLSSGLYSNDRAIIVHHHLGQGKVAGVKSQAQARRRVDDILRHMRSVHNENAEAVPPHNDFAQWVDELKQRPEEPWEAWYPILRALARRWGAHYAIRRALRKTPYLPQPALAYLVRAVAAPEKTDVWAAEMLLSCQSELVPDYVARAYHERVRGNGNDVLITRLRQYLLDHPRPLDRIRGYLADRDANVRLAASELLSHIGTLDDVALLADLLRMPAADDEDIRERPALEQAMWSIARRS